MVVATDRRMTLQEFLAFDDGSDDLRYELVDGALVEMNLGTGKHGGSIRRLAKYLEAGAVAMGTDWIAIQALVGIETTIGARGDGVRIPDVTLMSEGQWSLIEERSGSAVILRSEPAPVLVAEVLSPSTQLTDLSEKKVEYANRGIAEYWLIDPKQGCITVLRLQNLSYVEMGVFVGEEAIVSPTFLGLNLTAAQVLRVGRV